MSASALEAVANRVEGVLQERSEKEISASEIGGLVMDDLKRLDKVAYVRFASVYRHFRDVGEFMTELRGLLGRRGQLSPHFSPAFCCGRRSARRGGPCSLTPLRRSDGYAYSVVQSVRPTTAAPRRPRNEPW